MLDITDWRINCAEPSKSVAFPDQRPAKQDPGLLDTANALAKAISAEFESRHTALTQFNIEVGGIRYRCQAMGDSRYALRAIPPEVPTFEKLQIPKAYQEMLLSEDLRQSGGLLLIGGLTGSGKSSTLAAMVDEWLKKHGGYCLSLEDPPEYYLQGFHGKGYCDQIDVPPGQYAVKLAEALRCFPAKERALLSIGEIRDRAAAEEIFRIALNGHLVATTIHASSPITAVQRLLSLIDAPGEERQKDARLVLANTLKRVVYQQLGEYGLQINILDIDRKAANIIQNGNISNLVDNLYQTQRRMGGDARSAA